MERLVMALSDQQLLVGISILIAGFASHCSISVYHFSIVFDLAWFSSNTHLASLGALQICLAERPSLRTWRVCLMLITLIGIAVATILQGHQRWYTSSNSPAHCLFNDLPGNIHGPGAKGMAIRLTLLMYGYSFAITRLYHAPALGFVFWEKPASNLQNSRTGIKHFRPPKFFISGLKACFVVLTLGPTGLVLIVARKLYTGVFICLSSMLANLCFDVAWFAYGLWNIINNRKIAAQWMDGNENAWGFGQIMAVLLLSSVILTLRDLHAGKTSFLCGIFLTRPYL